MPEETAPATPAAALAPTKAPDQAAPVQTLSPESKPAESTEEKEARRAARAANAKRQFERLGKERAGIDKARADLAAEQNNWKAASARALQEASRLFQLEKLAKEDPVAALEQLGGVKFEDVLKKTATRGALTPESVQEMVERRAREITDEKLKAYKSQEDELVRQRQAKERETYEAQQTKAIKSGLADLVKANPDSYEFVSAFGNEGIEAAFNLIVEFYTKTADKDGNGGQYLTLKEALDNLEESYFDLHLARHQSSKKVKTRLEEEAAKQKAAAEDKAKQEAAAKATQPRWPRRAVQESSSDPNRLDQAASQAPTTSQQSRQHTNINDRIRARAEMFRAARTANDA